MFQTMNYQKLEIIKLKNARKCKLQTYLFITKLQQR